MTATVVVALALALARLAPSPDGKEIGMVWVIMFVTATTISTMTLLPASPLLMRTPPFGRGMLFAGLYAAFWVGLLWLVVLVAWEPRTFSPATPGLPGRPLLFDPLLRRHSDLGRSSRSRPRLPARLGPASAA